MGVYKQDPHWLPEGIEYTITSAPEDTMRTLPPTKLVKTDEHTSGFSSYDVVTLFDGMKLGQIFKLAEAATWTVCVTHTHPQYGEGLKVVGYRRTRSEAVERAVEAWLAPIDEVTAYAIVGAVQLGTQEAETDAARQLATAPDRRLTPGAFGKRLPLSVSTNRILQELHVHRADLANRLAGLKPAESYYLRCEAYLIRMSELELDRREKKAQRELENAPALSSMTALAWERRVFMLTEELGRAQAHAMRHVGLGYERVGDGELFEEVVFSRRRLIAQREKENPEVDALRTAAFTYQLVLNVSHERALDCAPREKEKITMRRFIAQTRGIGMIMEGE